jgi:hypothetical protein
MYMVNLETQKKGNVRRWKPLPSNDSKVVAEETGICMAP